MYLLPVDSHHVVPQRILNMMIRHGRIKKHLYLIIKKRIRRKKEIPHMLNCNLMGKRLWKLEIRKKEDLLILIGRKRLMIKCLIGNLNWIFLILQMNKPKI